MKKLFLIISVLIQTSVATAKYQELIASNEVIIANVSMHKPNRIEFERSKILEVIGNNSQYYLIATPSSKSIFLTPKAKLGENIELSIIYGDNQIQELRLHVISASSQAIFIKQTTEHSKNSSTLPAENTYELAEIIRHMVLRKIGKYHVQKQQYMVPQVVSQNLSLFFDLKYNFASKALVGRRLRMQNNSNKILDLSPDSFEHIFENVIAVILSKQQLLPKEEGYVYLISKLK